MITSITVVFFIYLISRYIAFPISGKACGLQRIMSLREDRETAFVFGLMTVVALAICIMVSIVYSFYWICPEWFEPVPFWGACIEITVCSLAFPKIETSIFDYLESKTTSDEE